MVALLVLGVAACGSPSGTDRSTPVSVTLGDNECDVAPPSATSGTIVFSLQNTGTRSTSFSLSASDGATVGQTEDLGPGEARDLVLEVQAGDYAATCSPVAGRASRSSFQVTPQ